jgi:hypothetical protein
MKTIYITDLQHSKIKALSESETKRRGKFISLQDIIEEAVDIGIVKLSEMVIEKA